MVNDSKSKLFEFVHDQVDIKTDRFAAKATMYKIVYIVTLLLIFCKSYGMLSSSEDELENVGSSTETTNAAITDVAMIRLWMEDKVSQLNAVRRQLQDHHSVVEMTDARQLLHDELSMMKQELQRKLRQVHSSADQTTRRTNKSGNVVTGKVTTRAPNSD